MKNPSLCAFDSALTHTYEVMNEYRPWHQDWLLHCTGNRDVHESCLPVGSIVAPRGVPGYQINDEDLFSKMGAVF